MIVDSSALIAFFVEDDPLHAKALEEFKRLENETFTIPDRILEETLNGLIYDHGIDYALAILGQIRENEQMEIQGTPEANQGEILAWMEQLRKKMSFQDYIVLYYSIQMRQAPLCFDRQILSLYEKLSS